MIKSEFKLVVSISQPQNEPPKKMVVKVIELQVIFAGHQEPLFGHIIVTELAVGCDPDLLGSFPRLVIRHTLQCNAMQCNALG